MTLTKGRADKTGEEFNRIHNGRRQSQTFVFSSLSTFLSGRDRDDDVGTILPLYVDSTGYHPRLDVLVDPITEDGTRFRGVTGISAARTATIHVTGIHGAHDMGHFAVITTEFSAVWAREPWRNFHGQSLFVEILAIWYHLHKFFNHTNMNKVLTPTIFDTQ